MNDICLTVFRSRGDIGEGAREKLAKGEVSRAERKGGGRRKGETKWKVWVARLDGGGFRGRKSRIDRVDGDPHTV